MPVDPAELLAGLDHASGAPTQRPLPVAPALDIRAAGRQMLIMLSTSFGRAEGGSVLVVYHRARAR